MCGKKNKVKNHRRNSRKRNQLKKILIIRITVGKNDLFKEIFDTFL